MAQFDVYRNSNPATSAAIPYLLDVQADLLDSLSTCVVVPLLDGAAMGRAANHLNPCFEIERNVVVMSTAELAGVSRRALGVKVCSLKEQRHVIIAALDFLFSGF